MLVVSELEDISAGDAGSTIDSGTEFAVASKVGSLDYTDASLTCSTES